MLSSSGVGLKDWRKLKSRLVRDWSLHLCKELLKYENLSLNGLTSTAISEINFGLEVMVMIVAKQKLDTILNIHN